MNWSGLNRQVEPALFGLMNPQRVLYDFDGPQIFTFEGSFGQELLAYLCSESGGLERFIVVPITPLQLGQLERGELPVREVLTSSWIWVVDRTYDGAVVAAWAVDEESIPRNVLPEPGILLIPTEAEDEVPSSSIVPSTTENAFVEIRIQSENRTAPFTNDVIFPSLRACTEFLKSTFRRVLNVEPEFVFSSAGAGSFVLRDEVRIAGERDERLSDVLKVLVTESRTGPHWNGLESWRSLLNVLTENRVKLAISALRGDEQLEKLELSVSRQRELLKRIQGVRGATPREMRSIIIDSLDVPQADDLLRVFRVTELRASGIPVTPESLGNITPRQVSYYTRAAKLLGLLDEEGELTPGGQIFGRLSDEDRLRAGVVHFESSVCGEAWIRWSGGTTLLDIRPRSAAEFLRNCSVGLSEDTQLRRAKTLSNWHALFIPHHYARSHS